MGGCGCQDDSGHVLGDRDLQVHRLLLDLRVGVAQDDGVARALCGILDAPRKFCEERVLDVGDDERDDLGLLLSQSPRGAIGGELQLAGCFAHGDRLVSDTPTPLKTRDTVAGDTPASFATS